MNLYFKIIIKSVLSLAVIVLQVTMNSCQKDEGISNNDFVRTIIVDGHIELNGFPQVFLTRNIPYYVSIDSSDIIYLVLRQAKVTVSDGVKSEILTLTYNKQYFPPFYYEGTDLKGEAGKTYYLTIEYGIDTLHATTTIPYAVKPDSAWFQPESGKPSKGILFVRINDDPAVENYYKFFTRIQGKQKNYYPTLISNFSDRSFNGQKFTFQLYNGPETYLDLNQKDFYYSRNDTILLKVCTLDKDQFNFWTSYQLEVANGANPFSSSFHKIESNIIGNGIGIWGGYGVSIVRVIAK